LLNDMAVCMPLCNYLSPAGLSRGFADTLGKL
jgi:hypothetical protein